MQTTSHNGAVIHIGADNGEAAAIDWAVGTKSADNIVLTGLYGATVEVGFSYD